VAEPGFDRPWRRWAEDAGEAIRDAHRWRTARPFDGDGPVGRMPDGRRVVSFASNDYLGLASHPDVRAAAVDARPQTCQAAEVGEHGDDSVQGHVREAAIGELDQQGAPVGRVGMELGHASRGERCGMWTD